MYFKGNMLSLIILLKCKLELKVVYKQLIISLIIWDMIFITLSLLLFSMTKISTGLYCKW